ncbi:hypothetical protein TNCV_187101 [Trichonephila clavipes]|nr:hypothetical protein TNCV_187101 [Trichonephila clavipes]
MVIVANRNREKDAGCLAPLQQCGMSPLILGLLLSCTRLFRILRSWMVCHSEPTSRSPTEKTRLLPEFDSNSRCTTSINTGPSNFQPWSSEENDIPAGTPLFLVPDNSNIRSFEPLQQRFSNWRGGRSPVW